MPFPFAATVIHLHAHLLISKSACSNAHTAMRFALESPPGRPPRAAPPLVHQRRKTCMPQCAHYVPLDPGNGAALVYIYHTNAKGHFAIYVKTFQQWPLYRTFRQSLVASSSTIAIIFALNAILFFFSKCLFEGTLDTGTVLHKRIRHLFMYSKTILSLILHSSKSFWLIESNEDNVV